MIPHFRIPLNLPHAGTIALRIARGLDAELSDEDASRNRLRRICAALCAALLPYRLRDENPSREQSEPIRSQVADLARELVKEMECLGLGSDRLGQCVRNLFECIELGQEGAVLSLRVGENPNSLQRPV